MGTVWLADDLELDRRVAVKFMLAGVNTQSGVRARFERESRLLARMAHPNIVTIFERGTWNNRAYFVMEAMDRGDLGAWIDTHGPLSLHELSVVASHACRALGAAHAAGIVHRDIKPANLLVNRDGVVKLSDFGVARATESPRATRAGGIGTESYMAPEQHVPQSELDGRADIYGLGATLYHLATGKRPLGLYARERWALLSVELPSALAAPLQRATEFDREARYPDAGSFGAALAEVLPPAAYSLAGPDLSQTRSPATPVPSSPTWQAATLPPFSAATEGGGVQGAGRAIAAPDPDGTDDGNILDLSAGLPSPWREPDAPAPESGRPTIAATLTHSGLGPVLEPAPAPVPEEGAAFSSDPARTPVLVNIPDSPRVHAALSEPGRRASSVDHAAILVQGTIVAHPAPAGPGLSPTLAKEQPFPAAREREPFATTFGKFILYVDRASPLQVFAAMCSMMVVMVVSSGVIPFESAPPPEPVLVGAPAAVREPPEEAPPDPVQPPEPRRTIGAPPVGKSGLIVLTVPSSLVTINRSEVVQSGMEQQLDAGTYTVEAVVPDGRRWAAIVTLTGGQTEKLCWDYDQRSPICP